MSHKFEQMQKKNLHSAYDRKEKVLFNRTKKKLWRTLDANLPKGNVT